MKSMRAGQKFPSENVMSAHKNTGKRRDDQRRLICREGNHNKAGKGTGESDRRAEKSAALRLKIGLRFRRRNG